ncbi:MAG: hypothetical protein ABI679_12080 [Gemmatimonadota bacterium]
MTCESLSDRMPEVALGGESFHPEELRHLETCAECAHEWRLVGQASKMGQSIQLDGGGIAATVLHRLATEPAQSNSRRYAWFTVGGMAAAAALVLLVLRPGRVNHELPGTPPPSAAFQIPLVELDSLNGEQLQAVLESIDEPLETPSRIEAPSMLELDDQQLERVLRSLEG